MPATQSDTDSNTPNDVLYRALKTLRGSFLLSIVAMGVVLVLGGVVFDSVAITRQDGVIAGMLGVFGISAIVVGGAFYALLTLVARR